jgi:hypothetical protein
MRTSAKYVDGNVRAVCPDCQTLVSFHPQQGGTHVVQNNIHHFRGHAYNRVLYLSLACGGCGRGGMAKVHDSGHVANGVLEEFSPFSVDRAILPQAIPPGVLAEFREAELCASVGATRAASALLRSSLEKALRHHGFTKGSLYERIEQAASIGILPMTLRNRAHANVKDLGNDILHEDWREVDSEEYESARGYVQRILESFFDDLTAVEVLLTEAKTRKG